MRQPVSINEYFQLLSEELENKGCMMLFLDSPDWNPLLDRIEDSDLIEEEGKEDEVHVTLLFGIDDEINITDIRDVMGNIKIDHDTLLNSIQLTSFSYFDNPEWDVLKIDLSSGYLNYVHNYLKSNLEYELTYPDYNPHLTVAYLKKGKGKEYVDRLNNEVDLNSFEFKNSRFVYSDRERNKTKL